VTFRELAVPGAWEITPTVHSDQRGVFLEAFTDREFTAMTGHRFDVRQVNTSVYVSEGLAHGFLPLQDDSTVSYMCSAGYDPQREHTINPGDPEIGIDWAIADPTLSPRDAAAPTLTEVRAAGLLPTWDDTSDFVERLRDGG
jgi:dTDP-4-dehydrorhamnose 3,5-epimerase